MFPLQDSMFILFAYIGAFLLHRGLQRNFLCNRKRTSCLTGPFYLSVSNDCPEDHPYNRKPNYYLLAFPWLIPSFPYHASYIPNPKIEYGWYHPDKPLVTMICFYIPSLYDPNCHRGNPTSWTKQSCRASYQARNADSRLPYE